MRFPFLLAALAFAGASSAQVNISLVGHLDYQALHGSTLANIWGYTDETGIEYALVSVCGTTTNPGGISVVSLADPANPQEVFFYEGPASLWREIKVWGDYAYMTTEASDGGLVIVDLSPLPQSTALNAITWLAPDWDNSHSLFIDENGRLYIHGHNRAQSNGGVIMYDLTSNPMDPVEVGEYDALYIHDSFARGDTLYAANIFAGIFSVVDVSDPANPVLLGTQSTPNLFTHNTWLDDSGHYLFTTDERTNAYVAAYDVTDPTDIQEVCRLRSDNGSGAIPHNTYWLNDYVIQSYYSYGVSIYDASDPHNMVEVGSYDTSPFSGNGFFGAWGVFPYFPSQRLVISDIEEGLFVLEPEYVQACRLEGMVTNAQTTAPVANAVVTIVGGPSAVPTAIGGEYVTGYHTAGTYTVQVTAFGYQTLTQAGVVLVNGQVTEMDFALDPIAPFNLQGNVVSAGSGLPVPGAHVEMVNPTYSFTDQADGAGAFSMTDFYADSYDVDAGQWGWRTACLSQEDIDAGSMPYTIQLQPGYYDDFHFNLGWEVTGNATAGAWVRDVPIGTTYEGVLTNPTVDASNDCGREAFVTANSGGLAASDDVDGGYTQLTSPVFDATGLSNPHVRYQRWFFNGGGSSAPNDNYVISLDNGSSIAVVEVVTTATPGMSSWQQVDVAIADFITPTSTMRLVARAQDVVPGHIMEAGLDHFEVVEQNTSAVPENAEVAFRLWPNPNNGTFTVRLAVPGMGRIQLIDATGRMVHTERLAGYETIVGVQGLPPGMYNARVTMDDGRVQHGAVSILH